MTVDISRSFYCDFSLKVDNNAYREDVEALLSDVKAAAADLERLLAENAEDVSQIHLDLYIQHAAGKRRRNEYRPR